MQVRDVRTRLLCVEENSRLRHCKPLRHASSRFTKEFVNIGSKLVKPIRLCRKAAIPNQGRRNSVAQDLVTIGRSKSIDAKGASMPKAYQNVRELITGNLVAAKPHRTKRALTGQELAARNGAPKAVDRPYS